MTATLDIRWREDGWKQEAVAVSLVRHIVRPQPHLRCPECDSILYSRRNKLCAVCGQELPEDMLFTVTEAARVKALLRTEQQKHRTWMNRRIEAGVG
jgi:predicted amidophosphoribosyltransferase